ncbi:hypothetical protein HanIR_Chr04g0206241 [Helianthus annuus]|nr:hypothetical protein HanIR_Chr04g0206241 [Helianthus annuus]
MRFGIVGAIEHHKRTALVLKFSNTVVTFWGRISSTFLTIIMFLVPFTPVAHRLFSS